MKKAKASLILVAIAIIGFSAFVNHKKSGKKYGLLYSCFLDKSRCHYVVIDIEVLDSLNASYNCEIGGYRCEVNINPDKLYSVKRKGAFNEIIEFDSSPNFVEGTGSEGFHFVYDLNNR